MLSAASTSRHSFDERAAPNGNTLGPPAFPFGVILFRSWRVSINGYASRRIIQADGGINGAGHYFFFSQRLTVFLSIANLWAFLLMFPFSFI